VERERVARTVHACSPRRDQPFVKVDCGALPQALLESEIFGYEPGAFTGAHRRKPGKIETARGGTIFLDEIGAMPRPLQAKLLRVLQDNRFAQPGSRDGARVDVRLVAAASEDLPQLVLEGRLHGELYRWLRTSGIHVPASSRAPRPPGAALVEPGVAPRADGPSSPRAATGHTRDEGDGLKAIARRAALDAERAVLKTVLDQVRWNRLEASRRLKISYKTLRWKIRQYGLDG
jgi:transcriptional regulator with PAS, ATPase and Fis domain